MISCTYANQFKICHWINKEICWLFIRRAFDDVGKFLSVEEIIKDLEEELSSEQISYELTLWF